MNTKHFLTLKDYSKQEILDLLELAGKLKHLRGEDKEHQLLRGKSLAMVFQKPSNRTRVSFEAGMYQLGGNVINIRPDEIQMGEREPVRDIARVLSRYVDIVMIRAIRHQDLEEFAEYATVPIINGLSDDYHPCQALADILTIKEKIGKLDAVKLCYIGDGNNVCRSLINICDKLEIELIISCPPGYEPPDNDGRAAVIRDPFQAVKGANVVYTDAWTSMGQEIEAAKREEDFSNYTVNMKLLSQAAKDVIFMHCLPAHRGQEVDNEVAESSHSVIFDQAENRLHAHKAVLTMLLRKDLA